jgi:hypothetical protein
LRAEADSTGGESAGRVAVQRLGVFEAPCSCAGHGSVAGRRSLVHGERRVLPRPGVGACAPRLQHSRRVFAVVLTGPPGAGKTVTLTGLSDALVKDGVAHSAVDVDEVAWSYPFPGLSQRCEHLRAWSCSHRRAGRDLLLVAEVIESPGHLIDVLAAVGADDHLLVRLDAPLATLRQRIIAREPPGWPGLGYLLDETPRLQQGLSDLGGVDLVLSTETATTSQVVDRIRCARPDKLS